VTNAVHPAVALSDGHPVEDLRVHAEAQGGVGEGASVQRLKEAVVVPAAPAQAVAFAVEGQGGNDDKGGEIPGEQGVRVRLGFPNAEGSPPPGAGRGKGAVKGEFLSLDARDKDFFAFPQSGFQKGACVNFVFHRKKEKDGSEPGPEGAFRKAERRRLSFAVK
jgi:hypothetical protein